MKNYLVLRIKKILLFALVVALGISCKKRQEGGECSYSFETISFKVIAEDLKDVPDLNITAKHVITGQEFKLKADSLTFIDSHARYVIANDNDRLKYSKKGDKVLIGFTHNNKLYNGEFVIANDGCHINKIAGPNEIKVD